MKTLTYQDNAEALLKGMAVKFSAEHLDSECPLFCDGKHIHGDRHRITFTRHGRRFSLYFWNSYSDMQNGELPTPYDVLACIQKSDPGTFEEFCSDFGYEADSRKAEKTYRAVKAEWLKVESFFTPDELEKLQEVA